VTYTHNLPPEPQFPPDVPSRLHPTAPTGISDFHAALLSLFSQHMPEGDEVGDVWCSCGNPLYAGHLVRLIEQRQVTATQAAVAEALGEAAAAIEATTSWYEDTCGSLVGLTDADEGALRAADVVRNRANERSP
jgi:hypothetical protein